MRKRLGYRIRERLAVHGQRRAHLPMQKTHGVLLIIVRSAISMITRTCPRARISWMTTRMP